MTRSKEPEQQVAGDRNPNKSCLIVSLCIMAVGTVSGTLFLFLYFDLSHRSFKPKVSNLLHQMEQGRYEQVLADTEAGVSAQQRSTLLQTCQAIHDLGALKAFYIQSAKSAILGHKKRTNLAVVAQYQNAANVHITIGLEKSEDDWHLCALGLTGSREPEYQ